WIIPSSKQRSLGSEPTRFDNRRPTLRVDAHSPSKITHRASGGLQRQFHQSAFEFVGLHGIANSFVEGDGNLHRGLRWKHFRTIRRTLNRQNLPPSRWERREVTCFFQSRWSQEREVAPDQSHKQTAPRAHSPSSLLTY